MTRNIPKNIDCAEFLRVRFTINSDASYEETVNPFDLDLITSNYEWYLCSKKSDILLNIRLILYWTSNIFGATPYLNIIRQSHLYELQKKLEGYKFPVYTTESCPRNKTEWDERSAVFYCQGKSSYACLPNENITELLEFCYPLPRIAIHQGRVL